ncbi:MAG: pantoate--beta-alanine ligase [Myxococcota bacterium]
MQAPRVVRRVIELQALSDAERTHGRRLALVPTMGALHDGHLALVEAARRRAETVVVSIFVNPTQFGPGEDLDRYPRTWQEDLAACAAAGVDAVFAPAAEEIYPDGDQTRVEVTELTRPLCGETRPGHFLGVTTVVAKLLVAARPQLAVFGEKDFQQLAAVRRLVRDLRFDVEIVGVPIVREADGLALSSRNALLDPALRGEARALVRALTTAERAVAGGERSSARLLAIAHLELAKARRGRIDYAELRDPHTLEPAPERLVGEALLALAVRFPARGEDPRASVRLIDNRVLCPPPGTEEKP